MCDFCGSFTDIDFAIGIETWTQDQATTLNYQARKMTLMEKSQAALALGNREKYYEFQREFWDFYYHTFPAYLPPTIDTPEKYALYLEVCAVSSVETGFDPKWQQYGQHQQRLQNALQYVNVNGQTKAESRSFFTLAEFFIRITREGMRSFYANPRYAMMHELLPEAVHFKMKTSMFVQAWLPYLTDGDADKLLKMLGFSNEYEEIERPPGTTVDCESCKVPLFAPVGSYKIFCEKCRTTTRVRAQFFCMSCGSPNNVSENPGKPIDCARCGIANRIVHPYFGR
jgi:LSD1 subclass zinc finger protein